MRCFVSTLINELCVSSLELLAMTGSVNMLNISRWTSEGALPDLLSLGGLFTGCFLQRICWIVKVPIFAGDETIVSGSIDVWFIAFFLVWSW